MDKRYLNPISNTIHKIKNTTKNGVLLVGEEGSGKTATILEYVKQNRNSSTPVIDITLLADYSLEINNEIAKLFHICSIIQKMLFYIKDNYLDTYVNHFIFFNARISNIQKDIVAMYSLGKYSIDGTNIDKIMLNNPEILLEEFLTNVMKYLNYRDITLIIDNFDVEKPYTRLYQTYMYELLKKYLKVVATVSDPTVINNSQKLNELNQNNDLIMMNYNRDINTVKRILDESMADKQNKKIISRRICFTFSDSTIEKLINKTNGNLFAMMLAIKIFFEQINEFEPSIYDERLMAIVDENLQFNSILISRNKTRKLYLK